MGSFLCLTLGHEPGVGVLARVLGPAGADLGAPSQDCSDLAHGGMQMWACGWGLCTLWGGAVPPCWREGHHRGFPGGDLWVSR